MRYGPDAPVWSARLDSSRPIVNLSSLYFQGSWLLRALSAYYERYFFLPRHNVNTIIIRYPRVWISHCESVIGVWSLVSSAAISNRCAQLAKYFINFFSTANATYGGINLGLGDERPVEEADAVVEWFMRRDIPFFHTSSNSSLVSSDVSGFVNSPLSFHYPKFQASGNIWNHLLNLVPGTRRRGTNETSSKALCFVAECATKNENVSVEFDFHACRPHHLSHSIRNNDCVRLCVCVRALTFK